MRYRSMAEIKRANQARGEYWFSAATMHFFDCRTYEPVIAGHFFITSEQDHSWMPSPMFTVRYADDQGAIHNASDLGEFKDLAQARHRALQLAGEHWVPASA